MGLLRRRGVLLKLLLLVPAIWFCAILMFAVQGDKTQQADNAGKVESPPEKLKVIQGFGPPMQAKVPESMGGGGPEMNNVVMPLPHKFVINQSDPIYKKGDSSQAGEMGKAVVVKKTELTSEQKRIFDEGMVNNAFNQYASDMISIHRTLPSALDKECLSENYGTDLPQMSVIICFHNEAWSVLLRTFISVIERTPDHLLVEVILVDDYSDKPHLLKPLDDYISQYPKVHVLRMEKREGLIRARLRGFEIAKGEVLTYLDSHCECTEGWAEPLLYRIKQDPKNVVCPVIDVIDDNTFEYHYSKAYFTNVGGFDWSLQFNWHPIPERDRKKRKRVIDPVPSPTMAGGLFSIDRKFFEYLGTYDPGFDIWGGENLELSFKTWMCGGVLEIVPCSHVGHIFRKRSPYKWRTGVNVLKRNSIRLAEVWLDEYKQYYYERINNQLGDFGDISDRVALRKRDNCKSFKWYLDNIFPELFVPGDAVAKGEVRNQGLNGRMCLDSAVGRTSQNKAVSLYPCHNQGGNQVRNNGGGAKQCLDWSPLKKGSAKGSRVELYWCHNQGGNQYWMLSKDGEIRRDESCVDYAGQEVMIFPCHSMKGNQEWKYDHKLHSLVHKVTGKCLEMTQDGAKLQMRPCETSNEYQQWVFKDYDQAKARQYNML